MDKKLLFEGEQAKTSVFNTPYSVARFYASFFCDVLYITVYGYSYSDEEIMLIGFDKMKSEVYLLNLQGTYRE